MQEYNSTLLFYYNLDNNRELYNTLSNSFNITESQINRMVGGGTISGFFKTFLPMLFSSTKRYDYIIDNFPPMVQIIATHIACLGNMYSVNSNDSNDGNIIHFASSDELLVDYNGNWKFRLPQHTRRITNYHNSSNIHALFNRCNHPNFTARYLSTLKYTIKVDKTFSRFDDIKSVIHKITKNPDKIIRFGNIWGRYEQTHKAAIQFVKDYEKNLMDFNNKTVVNKINCENIGMVTQLFDIFKILMEAFIDWTILLKSLSMWKRRKLVKKLKGLNIGDYPGFLNCSIDIKTVNSCRG